MHQLSDIGDSSTPLCFTPRKLVQNIASNMYAIFLLFFSQAGLLRACRGSAVVLGRCENVVPAAVCAPAPLSLWPILLRLCFWERPGAAAFRSDAWPCAPCFPPLAIRPCSRPLLCSFPLSLCMIYLIIFLRITGMICKVPRDPRCVSSELVRSFSSFPLLLFLSSFLLLITSGQGAILMASPRPQHRERVF